MGLKEFLVAARAGVADLQSRLKIHIVIGNESCDLDSTVSAITYAYFLHQIKQKPGTFYLPILNIPREQFRLRLETVYLLKKHNILADDLVFLSDVDLPSLTQNDIITLSVTLVDHHVLKGAEECLGPFIVEVLDHRPQECQLPKSWNPEIKTIGSCCSLVGQKILATERFSLDATVAELLLGTILKDTGNMSASANIGTADDHEMLVKLKAFLPPSISATEIYEEIYKEIRSAVFDLSSLTVSEMLHKDLKVLKGSHITVAMASITMNLREILSSPEFSHDATEFCLSLPADVLIIMTLWTEDWDVTHRCIAVFSLNRVYREQITDVILRSTSPNLDLQPMTPYANQDENVSAFVQNNVQVSRKRVLPLIRDFLAGEVSTPDENLNASGSSENQFSPEGQLESGSSGEKEEASEEEARRHINIAKAFQCDQFRTSQDRYDLAAVGMEAVLSPSLSSDSEMSGTGKKKWEDEDFDNEALGNIREEEIADKSAKELVATALGLSGGGDRASAVSSSLPESHDLAKGSQSGGNGFVDNLIDFGFESTEPVVSDGGVVTETRQQGGGSQDVLDLFSGSNLEETSSAGKAETPQARANVDLLSGAFGEEQDGKDDSLSQSSQRKDFQEITVMDHITTNSGAITVEAVEDNIKDENLISEDILQNHTPFDLLCPNNVDSPMDFSSMPTSGQASGQGSKVPSYPDTPPNSYMEPSGMAFMRETQLPSFNSSEMVRRIQEKKAALAGHSGKRSKSCNFDDDDSMEGFYLGGCSSSGGGGSLISPAVPQNSYMDLTSGFDFMSPGYQLPKLTNSDIMERVNEKRSQFEWSVESLEGSTSGVDVGPSSEESAQKLPFGSDGTQQLPVSGGMDPPIPYTPQNSYVEGSFDSFARNNLPSMNNAEIAAKIKAKQMAMFGSSSSGRVSRSSHGSDDSGGCRSPDVAGKSSRGASLDSPQVPYTPQNSYRDNLGVLDPRNKLPDLNEVAERLSIENSSKHRFGKRSTSSGGSHDEENVNLNIHPQNLLRQGRNSSSQSDSQNTMSDVESLMSVSTDVGTPSENVVASGIAGLMRNEIAMLSRKDTNDSDVFTPTKVEEPGTGGTEETKPGIHSVSPLLNMSSHMDDIQGNNPHSTVGTTRNGFPGAKELFSPVDSSQIQTMEDHAIFEAAENIVAQSVAAALQVSQTEPTPARETGRLRWNDNVEANVVDYDDSGSDSENSPNSEDDGPGDAATEGIMGSGDGPGQGIMGNEADFDVAVDVVAMQNHAGVGTASDFPMNNSLQHGDGHHNRSARNAQSNHVGDNVDGSLGQAANSAAANNLGDQNIADLALNELAYELANELIQSVLEDFPFNQVSGNGDGRDAADVEVSGGNAEDVFPNSMDIPSVRDAGKSDDIGVAGEGADDGGSSPNAGAAKERKSSNTLLDARKYSASSLDSNSSSSSSERKRSRDTDSSMTIMEDEIVMSFPERKPSAEFIPVEEEEEEEIIQSFPGRKFSKSEDFPPRRFSRDENSSRRSSRFDESELDVAIGPEGIETDYLPNMDPLQGNLDIIDASFSKITDADREVVEGESFRKVSGQEFATGDLEEEDGAEDGDRRMGGASENDRGDGFVAGVSETERDTERNEKVESVIGSAASGSGDSAFEEGSGFKLEAPKKPKKKKIRVSFSEDFDDEVGDFNIVSSSRSTLRSPPPPLFSQDSESSLPPPLPEVTGGPDEDLNTAVLEPKLSASSSKVQHSHKPLKEIYNTTAGRISIAGEDEGAVSGETTPRLPSITDQELVLERAQVGTIIESAERTISEADRNLDVFDVTPSLPSHQPSSNTVELSSSEISPNIVQSNSSAAVESPSAQSSALNVISSNPNVVSPS